MREAGNVISEQKDTLDIADLAHMLDAAVQAIMKRGKSQVGQKTILDSLAPASSAFSKILQTGKMDERDAIQNVIDAARTGAESTREMTSSIGRARWFSDRTLGVIDPGALSGYMIVKTVGEYIIEQGQNA
jgi:dihydroxyacetone kinase-like protein